MPEQIRKIQLSKLIPHPDNPNSMSDSKFKKLVRNIERAGLYEPIVVRIHPHKKNHFQIINGHHRVKALEQIGHKQANCIVWDVDDEQTAILLTTLNRLGGSDIPAKKIDLLKKLNERMKTAQLAKLLPQTAKQIDRLTNLKINSVPIKLNTEQFALPLVFFVTRQQKEIIENAIEVACCQAVTPSEVEGSVKIDSSTHQHDKPSNARRRAAAITAIASQFLTKYGDGRRENVDLHNDTIVV